MRPRLFILLLLALGLCFTHVAAQDKIPPPGAPDSSAKKTADSIAKKNIVLKPKHSPRIATLRSAILPGWGQAYNREYWKIPIVYGALAIPAYAFFYNNSFYKKTQFAYDAVFKATMGTPPDSSLLPRIDPSVKRSDGTYLSLADYESYRDQFRKDRDYSILWFFLVWGLNVMDATVFAHLKDFDVSNDLSLHIEPAFNSVSRTPGVGLVVNFKNPVHQLRPIP